MPSKTAKEFVT